MLLADAVPCASRARVLLVSDETVGALYADRAAASLGRGGFRVIEHRIAPGEASKRLSVAEGVYNVLAAENVGRDGVVLNEVWRDGPEACLGMTVSGFPNLFFLYGPNTNLGHSSIIVMIEAQVRYILSCLQQMSAHGIAAVDVRAEVQEQYNREMQERLSDSSWATVEDSWYLQGGKVTNNWPGRTTEYRRRTRHCNLGDFQQSR